MNVNECKRYFYSENNNYKLFCDIYTCKFVICNVNYKF